MLISKTNSVWTRARPLHTTLSLFLALPHPLFISLSPSLEQCKRLKFPLADCDMSKRYNTTEHITMYFYVFALPRYVNTQSNQVGLCAPITLPHYQLTHRHPNTHTRANWSFFQLLYIVCVTMEYGEKSNRTRLVQCCCVFGVSFRARSREWKCEQKQLCYWNRPKRNGIFVENLYSVIIFNGVIVIFFFFLHTALLLSSAFVPALSA